MNRRTQYMLTVIIVLTLGIVSGCGSNTQNSGKEPFGAAKMRIKTMRWWVHPSKSNPFISKIAYPVTEAG